MRRLIFKVVCGLFLTLVAAFAAVAGFTGNAVAQGDKIVAFVAFSDLPQEWENTKRAIIETGLIPDFKERLVELKERGDVDPDKLEAHLEDAAILLIPEQEKIDITPQIKIGERWAPVLKKFLDRGGRIVGLLDAVYYLQGARLTTSDPVDDITGATLEVVVPDHPLLIGVSTTFPAEDATVFYKKVDGDVLVTQKGRPERPVAFVKGIATGQIVILGFDFYDYNKDMGRLLANALVHVVTCKGSVELKANEFLPGQKIKPKVLTEARDKQYCILVAPEAKLLAIKLDSKGNLDIHVRHGKPVERLGKVIVADFSLPSPDGSEFLIIFSPQVKAGPYFIAVENKEDTEQEFTIIATPIADIQALKAGEIKDGSVDPNAGLLPFLRQYLETRKGLLGLTQYKFDVPKGAKSITIQLLGPKDKNLDLHLRYGKPVEIRPDGMVEADLSLIAPTGEEAVVLAGALLKPGSLYIAVESLEKEKQSFKVLVTVDTGGGLQTFIFE